MTLVTITPMQVNYSGATALAGGAIDTTDGLRITGGALRPILLHVVNTGSAGDVTVLSGTVLEDAPLLGQGNKTVSYGGTANGMFLVESARHSRGGDIYVRFGAGMTGTVYAIELADRSINTA